jgi:predicted PurR-regulated permease PerM
LPSVLPAVPTDRTTGLAALLLGLAGLSTLVLGAVVGTVFFAGTVAYLLIPVVRRVERLGVSRWIASALTAAAVSAVAVVPFALAVSAVRGRIADAIDAAEQLPETYSFGAFGYEYVVDIGVVADAIATYGAALAVDLAGELPVLALKLTLFGVLVFGLLVAHRDAERALLAVVPPGYRDVAGALGHRARATLYALYVLQAATAVATTAIALPVFYVFDVPYTLTLAVAAGVLQFVPIVGPSIVIAGVAAYWAATGAADAALVFLLVAGVLVAWLPDVLVRPRLSRETADLPGSLYFIGFTGGLLTVGPVGVIAGPLVVALTAEAASLLAEERNGVQTTLTDGDFEESDDDDETNAIFAGLDPDPNPGGPGPTGDAANVPSDDAPTDASGDDATTDPADEPTSETPDDATTDGPDDGPGPAGDPS